MTSSNLPVTILLHSSKTMQKKTSTMPSTKPLLLDEAKMLAEYIQKLSATELASVMKISKPLAEKTSATFAAWNTSSQDQTVAIDCFKGDIYSGFQSASLNKADRAYAQSSLVILSGLYGMIRPLDGIMPYRLEMMYKFTDTPFDNLYTFWGQKIADHIPKEGVIFNVSSVEYSKTILPFIATRTNDKAGARRVVTPQFYTINPKTKEPTFVTVHSKIARGAFARWLITSRCNNETASHNFDLLNYRFDPSLSAPQQPAFVAQEFGGIGLSVRLQK